MWPNEKTPDEIVFSRRLLGHLSTERLILKVQTYLCDFVFNQPYPDLRDSVRVLEKRAREGKKAALQFVESLRRFQTERKLTN
jgi:hypothetical protein